MSMNPPYVLPAPNRAASAAPATILMLLATCLSSPATAAPSTSASANAWSNQYTVPGTSVAQVSASFSGGGGPGSASANSSAGMGVLANAGSESACAIALPPDGQLCNLASASSSFTDQVTLTSDAPDGTHVQVLATFEVDGLLSGTGAYQYSSSGVVFTTGLNGASGSSGGLIATVLNAAISSLASTYVDMITNVGYPIGASSQLGVSDRCCFGGAEESYGMTISAAATLTLTVPVLPPGATYVHIVGSDGHDYSLPPVGVGDVASRAEGLSPAMPNPARGPARLDLTIARARPVDVGVFDIAGRRVATLARGMMSPGTHSLVWDGRDDRGTTAHGGMYLVRAMGEGLTATRRIVRLE